MHHAAAPHFAPAPQTVLVTGATGFIGQRLVQALLGDGHRVLVLSRDAGRANRVFGGRAQCVSRFDDIPPDARVDAVVNLAGARILGVPWTQRRRQVLLGSRVGLTQQLVRWMERAAHRPRLLLSASAIGYYGVQPQGDDTQLVERSPASPVFMSTLCQQWEAAAAQAVALGVDVVHFRLGLVLGHDGALPSLLLPVRLGVGGRLGTGRQWMSWIHIDDVIQALAFVWRRHADMSPPARAVAYNFTAPEQLTQLGFTQVAAQVLRRPCWLPVPGAPVRALLGEQSELLLEGQRVHPQALLEAGYAFAYPTAREALADLCLAPQRAAPAPRSPSVE